MHPEQHRSQEEELKDILKRRTDEIRLRDVKLNDIEWELHLIAEMMRRKKLHPD